MAANNSILEFFLPGKLVGESAPQSLGYKKSKIFSIGFHYKVVAAANAIALRIEFFYQITFLKSLKNSRICDIVILFFYTYSRRS